MPCGGEVLSYGPRANLARCVVHRLCAFWSFVQRATFYAPPPADKMFKWHANTAMGRSRPAAHDLTRVVDGIAASLRQFSISASRCAGEDRNAGTNFLPSLPAVSLATQLDANTSEDALRINRSSRFADASEELSSLPTRPSRGVDARSLAAPAPTFSIRRIDDGNAPLRARPNGFGPRSPGSFRGGMRSGGRGTMRGRGSRGQGGRGGRGKGKREKQSRRQQEDDGAMEPYTAEELDYIDHSKGGFQKPYIPVTSEQDLARWGPPVISSPRGVVETLVWKMAVATGNQNPEFKTGKVHRTQFIEGVGTLYENAAEKRKSKNAWGLNKSPESLSKQNQEDMMKQWAGGQYVAPQTAKEPGDVLAQIAAYTRRNETYLPADARKLEDKVRSLLPATITNPQPRSTQRPL